MEKNNLQKIIGKRKLVLLGYDSVCKEFYYTFYKFFDIAGYIVNKQMKQIGLQYDQLFPVANDLGLQKYTLETVDLTKYYIVLCNGYVDGKWHDENVEFDKVLFQYGFEYEQDYVDVMCIYQLPSVRAVMSSYKKEDILIFGCGKCGKTFFENFQTQYNIVGFLSNDCKVTECMGMPVYRVTKESIKDRKVVICSAYQKEMIEQLAELEICGVTEFATNKMLVGKIMLAIGTCQIFQTAELLVWCESFMNEYMMCKYIFDLAERNLFVHEDLKINKLVKYAAVVWYLKPFAGNAIYKDYGTSLKKINPNCMYVGMSNYFFDGLHPQSTIVTDREINPFTTRQDLYRRYQVVCLMGDKNINDCILKEGAVDELIERVRSEDFYSEKEVKQKLEDALQMLRFMDVYSDIKIYPYVRDNCLRQILFRDPIHLGAALMLEIVKQFLNFINCKNDISMEDKIKIQYSVVFGSYLPIYPSVIKHLHLQTEWKSFPVMDRDYKVKNIDFDQWCDRYVKYIKSVQLTRENAWV